MEIAWGSISYKTICLKITPNPHQNILFAMFYLSFILPMSPLMQRLIASKVICDSGGCIQREYIAITCPFLRRKYFKIETHNFSYKQYTI